MNDQPKSSEPTTSASGINRDLWLKALQEAGIPEDDEDDQGAMTINEFRAMFNLPWTTARHRLNALVNAGKATKTKKRVTNEYGRTNVVIAYRLT